MICKPTKNPSWLIAWAEFIINLVSDVLQCSLVLVCTCNNRLHTLIQQSPTFPAWQISRGGSGNGGGRSRRERVWFHVHALFSQCSFICAYMCARPSLPRPGSQQAAFQSWTGCWGLLLKYVD